MTAHLLHPALESRLRALDALRAEYEASGRKKNRALELLCRINLLDCEVNYLIKLLATV